MRASWCVKYIAKLQLALLGMGCIALLGAQNALAAPSSVVVKQLHFQQVNASTQIVLNLNALPQELDINDPPGRPMTISFKGATLAKSIPINRKFNWPNLSGVYIEKTNGRIQIFIKRNVIGTVRVVGETNRLVITIPNYYYKINQYQEIAQGVRHTHFVQRSSQGPVSVNVLEVDPRNPGIDVLPALASRQMGGKNNVSAIVSNYQAVAGINGSFFKPDVGTPLGILIINQELITGPLYDRVALGITHNNDLVMARVHMGGEVVLPGNRVLRIHNINQPRVQADTTVIYSSRWGLVAPRVASNGMQVQLRNGRVTAVSTQNSLPIPKDGFVVSGPKTTEMLMLSALSPTETARLNVYTLPDWSGLKHAIGGGPWLVKNGTPYVDLGPQHFTSRSLGYREPRSAVGITRDGKLLLVAVDGRHKNVSVGMTLHELAHLMQKLGAVNAMNLDGGSSTQMSIYGKTVNRPSAGNVGVSNSLIIRKTNGDNVALKNQQTLTE